MVEEINQQQINEKESDLDLLKKYKELQENSVSKEEYEKLVQEKKDIISSILNGTESSSEKKDERSIDDIRKVLFSEKELSNREYVENALALREKVIAEGGNDPFLPYGSKIAPTYEDERAVENVVANLKECLEIAEGDDNVFNRELERRLIETPMPKRK